VAFGRKVVILDEPTAALGVPEQEKVLSLIKDLKARGFSIILISHNLHHIFEVCDRIHVLRQGRTAGIRRSRRRQTRSSSSSPAAISSRIRGARPRRPEAAALFRTVRKAGTRTQRAARALMRGGSRSSRRPR
jgi:ABC-type sugar transport system ATPase subunit